MEVSGARFGAGRAGRRVHLCLQALFAQQELSSFVSN